MIEQLTSNSLSAAFLLRSLTSHHSHPHLLLNCGVAEVECIRLGLLQWGAAPVRHCKLPGPLLLPRVRRGTLLLEDVHYLNLNQQIALYDWMTPGCDGLQVISITTGALDGMVKRGEFLEGLYYRLNVVRLDIKSTQPVSPLRTAFQQLEAQHGY
jgi:DNA-binding NtrC family response regulator